MARAARWGTSMGIFMPTDELALLSLVQWLSPAFPTGGFAYSHALEQAVAEGEVTHEAALADWLADILAHGAGWNDAVLIGCALRGESLEALAEVALALATTRERRRETQEQGAAFSKAHSEMTGQALAPLPLPLAVARAARNLALPAERVIALFEHSFASNLVSAGVRFVPLGQSAGQRVLAGLHPLMADIAARAARATLADLASSAFRADLHSAAHETLTVRIFKT